MPEVIRIGTVDFRVLCDKDSWASDSARYGRGEDELFGVTDHMSATIHISPHITVQQKRLTLTHEVLHAMMGTLMGTPDLRWRGGRDKREEGVITLFEHPLLQVLRDNKELVRYLTAA